MILWLWLLVNPAAAIDINDHLLIELQGGERVEGWFLKAEADSVVVSVPAEGTAVTVPFDILKSVTLNDAPIQLEAFRREVEAEWRALLMWRADPPPHPAPGVVAVSGVVVAGSGHAMLGEWGPGAPMIFADTAFMTIMGLEASGHGTGRVDIFFTAALLSTVFKAYALADGYRRAQRRRARLGLAASRFEKSGS